MGRGCNDYDPYAENSAESALYRFLPFWTRAELREAILILKKWP